MKRHGRLGMKTVRLAMAVVCVVSAVSVTCTGDSETGTWEQRAEELRHEMRGILSIPDMRVPLEAATHRVIEGEWYTLEALTYASEKDSRVTAHLYIPKNADGPVPAVVVACGHGGSKSCFYAQYAGQLFTSLGMACIIPDTIGEEEREATGRMGARGHDLYHLGNYLPEFVETRQQRLVLGKIVLDLICGIDYLETRPDIDPERIGIVGYSLGGTTAGCVACIDDRVRAAVIAGWVFSPRYAEEGKYCSRMPYRAFDEIMGFGEMTALVAPHCATLFLNGDSDDIIDKNKGGAAVVRDAGTYIPQAKQILAQAGIDSEIEAVFVPGASHRPQFLSHDGASWLQEHLQTAEKREALPEASVSFGEWVDSHGYAIETLYNTEKRERGLRAVDCGAVYRDPGDIACFPGTTQPDPLYTMQGWVHVTAELQHPIDKSGWLDAQEWERDVDRPVVELGEPGAFDDTHIFAPLVMFEDGAYSMWYCGSRGAVEDRVFRLGYATGSDGVSFVKSPESPVFELGGGRSVLTPTLLRDPDGTVLREDGKLRMWFAAADLTDTGGVHTLHEAFSADGMTWSDPSSAQLENCYAPTIIEEGNTYRMWYTDVTSEPWVIRHAFSHDGKSWRVLEKPVLVIDQEWEKDRLFYPAVLKSDGYYIIWYGSYWSAHDQKTAIGSAVSHDGVTFVKNPHNPVFRPDENRVWESHYTTSQTVLPIGPDIWRIWYASRTSPPFVNKYYAIGTAIWRNKH